MFPRGLPQNPNQQAQGMPQQTGLPGGNQPSQQDMQNGQQLMQQYQQALQGNQQMANAVANPQNRAQAMGLGPQQQGPNFAQYAQLPNVQRGLQVVGNFLNGIGHPLAGIFSQFHMGVPGQTGSVPNQNIR